MYRLDILFLFLMERNLSHLVRRLIAINSVCSLHGKKHWDNIKIFHWQGIQRMLVNLPTLKSSRGLKWRIMKRLLKQMDLDCNLRWKMVISESVYHVMWAHMCVCVYSLNEDSVCFPNLFPFTLISDQVRIPAEFKHIIQRRKRNQTRFP